MKGFGFRLDAAALGYDIPRLRALAQLSQNVFSLIFYIRVVAGVLSHPTPQDPFAS